LGRNESLTLIERTNNAKNDGRRKKTTMQYR